MFCAATRVVLLLAVSVGLSAFSGCAGGSGDVSAQDHAAITAALETYLPAMAKAYASGDLEPIRPFAAEKEMSVLYRRISDLMNNQGRVLVPTLRSVAVEDVKVWNHSNAFVTTFEVWDLKVLVSGTDQATSQVEGQRNRVKYQLKRRQNDTWQVLYREIVVTFDQEPGP